MEQRVAAVIAACHSKACAPPPVGSGGSTGGGGSSVLSDPKAAAHALIRSTNSGKVVTVDPKELGPILDSMAGDKSMMMDLGKVNVRGTHLFARAAGKIKRENMPQIPDEHRDTFVKELREAGVTVEDTQVDPKQLRPTQSEFAGPKVGKMLQGMRKEGWFGNPILVTSDGYILDGHHRWAAKAAQALEKPGVKIPVTRIDMPIAKVLTFGLAFDKRHNIPLQGLADGIQAAA